MRALPILAVALLFTSCDAPQDQTAKPPSKVVESEEPNLRVASIDPVISDWPIPEGTVCDVTFSYDDELVSVTFCDPGHVEFGRVLVIRVDNGEVVLDVSPKYPRATCFAPSNRLLAIQELFAISVYQIESSEEICRIDNRDQSIGAIGFSNDGIHLLGGAEYLDPEYEVRAWRLEDGVQDEPFEQAHEWRGRGLAPNGLLFFAGGYPGPTPRVYKTDLSGRLTFCFRREYPRIARFTRDSQNLVTYHTDGQLVLWELVPTDHDNARQLASLKDWEGCSVFDVSRNRRVLAYIHENRLRIRELPIEWTNTN